MKRILSPSLLPMLLMACGLNGTPTFYSSGKPSDAERAACAEFELSDPSAAASVAAYWPPGTFDSDPNLDGFVRAWYSSQLCAMGEPRLSAGNSGDRTVIRFLWLRSFDPGIAIRVTRSADAYRLSTIRLDGAGGYAPGNVALREERAITASEWHRLTAALKIANYWALPTSDRSNDGLDGSQWIVEAVEGGKHHVVDRWMGRDIGAIGKVMLELARLEMRSPAQK